MCWVKKVVSSGRESSPLFALQWSCNILWQTLLVDTKLSKHLLLSLVFSSEYKYTPWAKASFVMKHSYYSYTSTFISCYSLSQKSHPTPSIYMPDDLTRATGSNKIAPRSVNTTALAPSQCFSFHCKHLSPLPPLTAALHWHPV